MGLFGKKKTMVRRPYRKPSEDEIDRKEARKEKQEARDKFLTLTKDNPELEREWVSKMMGIEIKPPDPSEIKKKEIHTKLVEEAFKQITNDPELRKQYAEQVLGEIVGEVPSKFEGRDYGGDGGYGYGPLEALDIADQIKERLGGGNSGGFSSLLKDPDVAAAFFGFLQSLMGRGDNQPQPLPQRTYVVRVNGRDKEVPEEQYKQLIQSNQLRPVAELTAPEPEKQEVKESNEFDEVFTGELKQEPSLEQLPEFLSNIDTDMVLGWMDMEPDDFVIELKEEVQNETGVSRFLWGFLNKAAYDSIVVMIAPHRENSKIGVIVERILSDEGKFWLEKVIELVQGEQIDG